MALKRGVSTGLLGYSLRKERLGEGLFFREIELFTVDAQAANFNITDANAIKEIQDEIKAAFSLRSGDVSFKSWGTTTDYQLPNDAVRIARFNFQVERRNIVDINISALNSSYYDRLDEQSFWDTNGKNLQNFSEEFVYEKSDNGAFVANHNISFSLQTGNKAFASALATDLFGKQRAFAGVGTIIGSQSLLDATTVQQFYTETYDLLQGAYSFSKKVEYPPSGSDAAFSIKKEVSHSLELGEDGIINISEKGRIKGFNTMAQAQSEFFSMKSNNAFFTRCNSVYNAFTAVTAATTNSLKNYPIKGSYVMNGPGLSVEYEYGFTDDPSLNTSGVRIERGLDVALDDNRVLNLNHSFNFSYEKNVTSSREADNVALINIEIAASQAAVNAYYTASPYFNANWPNLTRVKASLNSPQRTKNFGCSLAYTNEPIFNVTGEGVLYKKLDFKISDNKPVDQITEYKIINRPSKKSVLNYGYQTERGEKSISVTAIKSRTAGNTIFTSPANFNTTFYSLYVFAVKKLLESFNNNQVLAFTYFVSDIKCGLSSNYDLTMSVSMTYTIKKYRV